MNAVFEIGAIYILKLCTPTGNGHMAIPIFDIIFELQQTSTAKLVFQCVIDDHFADSIRRKKLTIIVSGRK